MAGSRGLRAARCACHDASRGGWAGPRAITHVIYGSAFPTTSLRYSSFLNLAIDIAVSFVYIVFTNKVVHHHTCTHRDWRLNMRLEISIDQQWSDGKYWRTLRETFYSPRPMSRTEIMNVLDKQWSCLDRETLKVEEFDSPVYTRFIPEK